MTTFSRTLSQSLAVVLPFFVLAPGAGAGVRVVNGSGGAPYTTIQAAVDAAVDGDVILVRAVAAFSYAGFTITNKALSVVGDSPSGVQLRGPVTVQSLTASRTVVVAGFNISLPASAAVPVPGFRAFGDVGEVRVQHCTISGAAGIEVPDFGYGHGTPGGLGLLIENCSGGVAFEACTISGGAGGGIPGHCIDYGADGGDAAQAIGTRVVLFDCTLQGGIGGTGASCTGTPPPHGGGNGGSGMLSLAGSHPSQLLASDTSFAGARGGDSECFSCGASGCCDYPGSGGNGLSISTGSLAWRLDSTFVGGFPGGTVFNLPHHPGQAGQGVVNTGLLTDFQVSKVAMTTPSIVRGGTQMTFAFTGDPGDEIYLLQAPRTSFIGRVSWRGFLLARPSGPQLEMKPLAAFVTIPGSGQVSVSLPAPVLDPGVLGKTVYYQAYRKTATGSITLGSFAALTVVDPSF